MERLLGWARIALPIGAVWCVSVGSGTTAAVLLIGWLLRGPLARRYISAVAIAVARDNAEAYHLLRSNGGLHATLR
ncbi:MAG: hypothetical protein GWO16_05205 [Gammaproteobacteria bacterium]|nr:hypothetical protein [Gammaproteobacteria bacterium]NIR97477.1 hypothetical protein [Gammaproteobacteria bacterium]NIV20066.1 hypothetical protein [Gammaproteobacteria bacterium]